jgi:hypothetical protein
MFARKRASSHKWPSHDIWHQMCSIIFQNWILEGMLHWSWPMWVSAFKGVLLKCMHKTILHHIWN